MRKFWSVRGQLVEVQRYINVPMRWCEQYPARERRELWVSTTGGNDIKLIVHSREMPARRGHQVNPAAAFAGFSVDSHAQNASWPRRG